MSSEQPKYPSVDMLLEPFSLKGSTLKGTSIGGDLFASGKSYTLRSPVDGRSWIELQQTASNDYEEVLKAAQKALLYWSRVPAPKRGELVRRIGLALRTQKEALAQLISYEIGKTLEESRGEVQEMIDICDYAQGLSRQLYGLSMHSERPSHRMYEQYHPLGVVGIISAFNFPVAVWSWNAIIAWVCGNVCIWKPSEQAPVSAIALQTLIGEVCRADSFPEGISCLVTGDAKCGARMSEDKRIPLISATGSVRMGRSVAEAVGRRLGRSLLELGGNNAMIISEKCDQRLALRAALFGATGTSGQRCTTTRRLIIHQSIYEGFLSELAHSYAQLRVGNPLDTQYHLGPLIDTSAVASYEETGRALLDSDARAVIDTEVLRGPAFSSGCYVRPAIYKVHHDHPLLQRETFVPILYAMPYDSLEEAINWQNNVPEGLSSSIMTNDVQEMEHFLSSSGSDCGIANVNIGTSGAEIGGAFGGEKDTGGGREAGSDAWKSYMRRQTTTINYSNELPLSQGIRFLSDT